MSDTLFYTIMNSSLPHIKLIGLSIRLRLSNYYTPKSNIFKPRRLNININVNIENENLKA